MSFFNKNIAFNAIILYVGILIIIAINKPSLMYNGDEMKDFGSEENQTYFAFPIVAIILSIVIYFVCYSLAKKKIKY